MSEPLNNVVIHCKGLIFDDRGSLLLVKQAEYFGTYWNAPGGRLDGDESLDSCLVREVREETGLIVESANVAYTHAFVEAGQTDLYIGFHVTEYAGVFGEGIELTESEQVEIVETRFVSPDEELDEALFPPRLREVAAACFAGASSGVTHLGTNSFADWDLPG